MHRMVLLGDEAQMEARFGLFGYGANPDCTEHTVSLEIVLDAPDGTGR
jgi:hypothetical protein